MFKAVHFVKIGPNFVGFAITHLKIYQNILWNTLLFWQKCNGLFILERETPKPILS